MSIVDPSSARSLPQSPPESSNPTHSVDCTPHLSLEANGPRTQPLPVFPSQRLAAQVGRSLRRRWLLAVLFGLFGSGAAADIIWSLYPAQHTAEVWLQITHAPRSAAEADKDDSPPQSYAPLLKSPRVLAAALQQPELQALLQQRPQAQPLDWLDQHLQADAPAPGVVRVTAVSSRADEPGLLAEAVAVAFVQEIEARNKAHLIQTKDTYRRLQEELRTQRAALANLENPRLDEIEKDEQQLRLALNKLDTEFRTWQGNLHHEPIPPTEAEIEELCKSDALIQECSKEIERLDNQIKAYQRISARGSADPAVGRLMDQQNNWKKKLSERHKELASQIEQQVWAKEREVFLSKNDEFVTKATTLFKMRKALEAERKTLANNGDEAKLQTLRDEVAANQETARRLAAEVQTLEAEAKNGPGVERLGEPRQFPHANGSRRWVAAGSGAAVTFLMLALFIGLLETRDRRVKTPGDVGHFVDLPLLGALPNLKTPPTASDSAAPEPLAEAVDVLRTLLLQRLGGGPCIVLVTSAVEGEGKTALASHLAASLARAWRKTLLIDGNLRAPGAHQLFQATLDPGFSEVLRGDVEAAEAIQPTPLNRLWLLPAGRSDAHALQALAQQDGAAFLEGLREQYEFIIVDSAAVLPVADTLLLSRHTDVVLLTVRCGLSQLPSVRAAQQRLNTMGAPLFGTIVLGASLAD